MASEDEAKKARIEKYIDTSLKQVFSELENDEMPDQLVDLLAVLRAQDQQLKSKK